MPAQLQLDDIANPDLQIVVGLLMGRMEGLSTQLVEHKRDIAQIRIDVTDLKGRRILTDDQQRWVEAGAKRAAALVDARDHAAKTVAGSVALAVAAFAAGALGLSRFMPPHIPGH